MCFCKYWYDPTNEHIIPSNLKQGYWKFDTAAKCVCLKNNLKMGAGMRCSKYECKIQNGVNDGNKNKGLIRIT